jgi:hypothetical protein
MRLYVIEDYRSRDIFHPKGAVLEVSLGEAVFLTADAPGCFSPQAPRDKEIDSPPADKMMRKGKAK